MSDTPVTPTPEQPKDNIVADVVKPVEEIVKDSSSIVNNIKIIALVLGLLGVVFGVFKGCSCIPHIPIKIGPTVVKDADPTQPTNVTSTTVTYTPKGKDGKDGKPVTIKKPVEGKVTIKDGVIKIQNSGFVFVPKAGAVYSFSSQEIEWAVGARLIFVSDFGLEVMGNNKRLFTGIDVRDPFLNVLTTSAGISTPYASLGQISPYLGEEATLIVF